MKTVGGSIRQGASRSVIAAAAALLIALGGFATRLAEAAEAPAEADTTTAAALYEPAASGHSRVREASKSPGSRVDMAAESAESPDPEADPQATAKRPDAAPVTTETVIVPASMPAPSYVKQGAAVLPSTTEIPQSMGAPAPATEDIDRATDPQSVYFQARQNPQLIDPQLRSLQEFMSEGDESSPLGVELREDQRKLNSGEIANGLLIVSVRKGSAAALGGLREPQHTARNLVTGVAVAAAMFFPPAVLAVPLIEQANLGDSYDMIIGVDGARVVNFVDFEDRMRDVQPGEIVYLSVVRNGDRVQLPVHVQSLTSATF
jgi:hypothetical protein